MMQLQLPQPPLTAFESVDWASVVPEREDDPYELQRLFAERSALARAQGDTVADAVYQVLTAVCSFSLRLDEDDDPFSSASFSAIYRIAAAADLDKETAQSLGAVASRTSNAFLRARLGDVAWVRARNYRGAKIAIESYESLFGSIDPANWTDSYDYLVRAVQLAAQLGPKNPELPRVVSFVEGKLTAFADSQGFLCAKLLGLLRRVGAGDAKKCYEIALSCAKRRLSDASFDGAREYAMLAVQWAESMADSSARQVGWLLVSDAAIAQAELALSQPTVGPLVAAMHITRAIDALRACGGHKERVEELHARLMEVQRESAKNIPTISHSVDISNWVDDSTKAVEGKSLDEALVTLIVRPGLLKEAESRRSAEDSAKKYLLMQFFPPVLLNREGKVIDKAGSVSSSDPDVREAAILAQMFEHAARQQHFVAQALIEPMRSQFVFEHAISADDVAGWVYNTHFVPPGRERLFAEGLYAGFQRDLVTAVHLLVPQLENSIRVLLARAGVRVSGLDQEGIQMEYSLNRLLYEPKLRDLLGDDTVFALQGLLISKFGSDIRNNFAHGLTSYGDFFSWNCFYLWWLTLRICLLPPNAHRRLQGLQERESAQQTTH
jgi:hypothetical protein